MLVPVDDAEVVRRLEGLGDLSSDREGIRQRDRVVSDLVCERRPFDQLHDQGRLSRLERSRP